MYVATVESFQRQWLSDDEVSPGILISRRCRCEPLPLTRWSKDITQRTTGGCLACLLKSPRNSQKVGQVNVCQPLGSPNLRKCSSSLFFQLDSAGVYQNPPPRCRYSVLTCHRGDDRCEMSNVFPVEERRLVPFCVTKQIGRVSLSQYE